MCSKSQFRDCMNSPTAELKRAFCVNITFIELNRQGNEPPDEGLLAEAFTKWPQIRGKFCSCSGVSRDKIDGCEVLITPCKHVKTHDTSNFYSIFHSPFRRAVSGAAEWASGSFRGTGCQDGRLSQESSASGGYDEWRRTAEAEDTRHLCCIFRD